MLHITYCNYDVIPYTVYYVLTYIMYHVVDYPSAASSSSEASTIIMTHVQT